jgi:hypothetical protein
MLIICLLVMYNLLPALHRAERVEQARDSHHGEQTQHFYPCREEILHGIAQPTRPDVEEDDSEA